RAARPVRRRGAIERRPARGGGADGDGVHRGPARRGRRTLGPRPARVLGCRAGSAHGDEADQGGPGANRIAAPSARRASRTHDPDRSAVRVHPGLGSHDPLVALNVPSRGTASCAASRSVVEDIGREPRTLRWARRGATAGESGTGPKLSLRPSSPDTPPRSKCPRRARGTQGATLHHSYIARTPAASGNWAWVPWFHGTPPDCVGSVC